MAHRAPWWLVEFFDRTLRGLLYDAEGLVGPYVRPGDRVADIGCGTGFHSVALSRLVGGEGEVLLVDAQQSMRDRAVARCERDPRATARLTPVLGDVGALTIAGHLDFALLSWMLHEVTDVAGLWRWLAEALAPRGCGQPPGSALITEPRGHVGRGHFERELAPGLELGLSRRDIDGVFFSYAVVLSAPEGTSRAGTSEP